MAKDKKTDSAPKPASVKKQPRVAKGRSITSLRGVLDAGTVVGARDFPGGEDTLCDLIKCGAVVEV